MRNLFGLKVFSNVHTFLFSSFSLPFFFLPSTLWKATPEKLRIPKISFFFEIFFYRLKRVPGSFLRESARASRGSPFIFMEEEYVPNRDRTRESFANNRKSINKGKIILSSMDLCCERQGSECSWTLWWWAIGVPIVSAQVIQSERLIVL